MPETATVTGPTELLEQAHRDGVQEAGNRPFYLAPAQAANAVLLVHGFTASPFEMRAFGETLAEAGLASLGIRLPGHGTTPEDLAQRTWQEWLASVGQGYDWLKQRHQQVYGAGMSTGCLLLLAMQLQAPLEALVLFSPYLAIRHRLSKHAGLLKYLRPYHEVPLPEEAQRFFYARRPVAGVDQINRLIRHLEPRLKQVRCPVLAFNGLGDQTVDPVSGKALVEQLGSPVRIHQMANGEVPHVLTTADNPLRGSMFELAVNFLQELEKHAAYAG